MKPSNDREAITLILEGMVKKGCSLVSVIDDTWNKDEVTVVTNVEQAVKLVTGVDEAFVRINLPDSPVDLTGQTSDGYIYFVLGNDPEEVVCDHTVNLSEFIDPIVSPWWE